MNTFKTYDFGFRGELKPQHKFNIVALYDGTHPEFNKQIGLGSNFGINNCFGVNKPTLSKENIRNAKAAGLNVIEKNILSDDEYNNKVNALNKKFESFQSDARAKVQKMKSLRDNGLQKIMNELNIILSEYSKKNELTFIIDQKNIIIGKTDLNITNEILKLLDQKLKKVKIN
mgnify:CR=1 FL=1